VSKLIIKLDSPIYMFIFEDMQLLLASEIPSDNISQVLQKIGDFAIEEIYVYVKFDTRQQAEGIRVDHISNTFLDRDFYISTFDYDALKAIAVRVQAKRLSFYSAYRHFASMLESGVVVDSYIGSSFVIATIQDYSLKSLNICSYETLQRTVENCEVLQVIYARQHMVPPFKNVDCISEDHYRELSFIQFILNSNPCYVVDLELDSVFFYGDLVISAEQNVIEKSELIKKIQNNLAKKKKVKKHEWSKLDIKILGLYIVAGIFMSSGIYGTTKLKSDTSALSVKKQEQELFIKQLNSEKSFLQDAIDNFDGSGFTPKIEQLRKILSVGDIKSLRVYFDGIEMTLFVESEEQKDVAISELESVYRVECILDGEVEGENEKMYQKYNVFLYF